MERKNFRYTNDAVGRSSAIRMYAVVRGVLGLPITRESVVLTLYDSF
jgi:hypothetical protein